MKTFMRGLYMMLVLALLLTGCSSPATTPSASQEPTKIRMQLEPYMSYIPLYIADKEGYLAEQGLQLEDFKLEETESLVGLAKGQLDLVADILNAAMINNIAKTKNLKIVADKGYIDPEGCNVNALSARKDLVDSGLLADPAGFTGLSIVFDPLSIEGLFMEKILSPAGLTLDALKPIELESPAAEIDAFNHKSIDLTIDSEPWVTRNSIEAGTVVVKGFKDILPNYQYSIIIFGPSLLEKNPEAGRRLMVAYLKAVKQYNQGKTDRNLELMAAFTGLDRELLKKTCWPYLRADGTINFESVNEYQAWAVKQGLLEQAIPQEQYWDGQYIEFAKKTIGG